MALDRLTSFATSAALVLVCLTTGTLGSAVTAPLPSTDIPVVLQTTQVAAGDLEAVYDAIAVAQVVRTTVGRRHGHPHAAST